MAEKQPDNSDATTQRLQPFVVVGAIVLLASLVVDEVFGHQGFFGFDGFAGFYALFGLLAGLVIIALAKGIGAALKRPDTYYDD